jgi:hypothetical protein
LWYRNIKVVLDFSLKAICRVTQTSNINQGEYQMKLIDLLNAKPALTSLATTKLPAKVAYRIGKSINKIDSELRTFEDTRINFLNELGILNKETNQYEFVGDNAAEFQKAIAEVQAEDVTLELPKFTLDELGDIKLEPLTLAALDQIGMISEI